MGYWVATRQANGFAVQVYKPHWKAILQLYKVKFSKNCKLDEEEAEFEELLRLDAELAVAEEADDDCDQEDE